MICHTHTGNDGFCRRCGSKMKRNTSKIAIVDARPYDRPLHINGKTGTAPSRTYIVVCGRVSSEFSAFDHHRWLFGRFCNHPPGDSAPAKLGRCGVTANFSTTWFVVMRVYAVLGTIRPLTGRRSGSRTSTLQAVRQTDHREIVLSFDDTNFFFFRISLHSN